MDGDAGITSTGRARILYVHHRSELGGAPTSLSYIIRNLDRDRFDPHVFCPPGPAADLFREVGATVHTGTVACFTHIWASVYRGRRWLLLLRELSWLPAHLIAFRRVLRSYRFDIVHLNDSPLIVAGWLARCEGIPVLWHLRSALPDDGTSLRSRFIRHSLRTLATTTIAINKDVAESFGVGSDVVHNTVDLERFRPGSKSDARHALGLDPERLVITFFGFLYPSKGFQAFINAAGEIIRARPETMFMIVGGAVRGEEFFRTPLGRVLNLFGLARNYDRETRRLITHFGIDDHVAVVPFTPDTALRYQASDIVISPSRGPELGRPVIEAAATGVPVVATGSRTGGGVLIDGATGVLSEHSVPALVQTITSLIDDPARRETLGKAARRHAERTFDPAVTTRRIEAIYVRLLWGGRRTKVLFVHHRIQLGGAPTSLAGLIRNLGPAYEPHVYVPEGPSADLFRSAGATVHPGPTSIFAHAWDSPYRGIRWLILGREILLLPAHLVAFIHIMRTGRYPIVHLNDSPLLLAAFIAKRRRAKVVWHLRSALAGEGRDRRSRAIARLIDRWGDAAIAIDADVAAHFPIQLPVTIVHNSVAVRPGEAESSREALGLPAGCVLVGFAGFVRRQKGWPELVEAARILAADHEPVHFVIIGGGIRSPHFFSTPQGRLLAATGLISDEESAITALVERYGILSYFSFIPFTSDTSRIYAALDVMTFPNQGIGLGRPVLEAAMHGKPVVASGSRDGAGILVPEVTGILLEKPTPEAIAEALRRLVHDDALRLRMGEAGAAHARASFDPERNARMVEVIYARLLGRETEGAVVAPAVGAAAAAEGADADADAEGR